MPLMNEVRASRFETFTVTYRLGAATVGARAGGDDRDNHRVFFSFPRVCDIPYPRGQGIVRRRCSPRFSRPSWTSTKTTP